ncbi:MAG: hypothetical protein ACT4OM_13795 [Actinomycetota bacterium]
MPTGIPIAQTGLSIYGFQGLLAYNMALKIDQQLPPDERYYALFVQPPIGMTDVNKWEKRVGQNGIGFGIVLGTADKGFAVNVKGLLIIAFPDLTILLQAKANFIKLKPDLSTTSEGTLDALMVYASGQSTISIDIVAFWGIPVLLSVSGHARAFFSFADPTAWYLEIGRDEDGKRVTAQAIEWNNRWLFAAGFWFRLDQHGVVTGVLYDFQLRVSKGGFGVEVYGMARGEMGLYWEPPQWEGSLAMEGRIVAGYKGISVAIVLRGDARARVMRPFDVLISVRACVSALFWDVCKSFDFHWERLDAPQLESPVRRWAATPRHWTPRRIGAGSDLDMGIVAITPGAYVAGVQPHSVIALDFGKPMVDQTNKFNEAVALNDGGFVTIGRRSGWSGAWRLDGVTLVRDPDGARQTMAIWGTWAHETPQKNTTLRLGSSERFGHDGSLSSGFVDGLDLDYCDEPEDTVVCISLDGIAPGYGVLEDGSLYRWWNPDKSGRTRRAHDDRICGVLLEPGDRLEIDLPTGVDSVEVVTCSPPRRRAANSWVGRLCARLSANRLLRKLPLVRLLIRLCERRYVLVARELDLQPGSISSSHREDRKCPDVRSLTVKAERDGNVVIKPQTTGKRHVCRICYRPGHGTPEWVAISRRGGSMTANEFWTVPPEMKLLPPNEVFELEVTWTARMRSPQGSITQPRGTQKTKARFATAGPPNYRGALEEYIAGVYPFDGARPVYLGYDLSVTFKEDYVPYLYAAAGERLVFRLFDGQGRPVLDAHGNPFLVPATALGPVSRSVSERYWEEMYQMNVERGCLSPGAIKQEGETVRTSSAKGFSLTPNSQYVAMLVSDARSHVGLAEWGFTTSRFATFSHLVSSDVSVKPPQSAVALPTTLEFDTSARAIGILTVAFVDRFTMTPILTGDASACIGLLLESPEPLEAGTRLTVAVRGAPTVVLSNADHTRCVVRPESGSWALGLAPVTLTWRRDATPKLTVDGDSSPEVVSFQIDLAVGP